MIYLEGKLKTEIIEKQKEYIDKIKVINNNKKLYYYILTMGCQLNENDSEKLSGIVEKMGYIKTEDLKLANLCILNTCCIRENAEEKVFGKLRRI
jgi:tRNA-2-methylthio-N6-dimethylallyladenosine synthase